MNRWTVVPILALAAMLGLLLAGCASAPKQPLTPLVELSSDAPCAKCFGYLMPGGHLPSPRTAYRIDSDLPEIYNSTGVLYTTRDVLPPYLTLDGRPVPESLRQQRNNGFDTIDDSFEVFLYHLARELQPGETRRIVVYAKNIGAAPVTVHPRQIVLHGPNAARETSVESVLGERVLLEQWDVQFDAVTIAPGQGRVIGYTKRVNAADDGPDTARHAFVNGTLRADIQGARPRLEVSVIAIPGAEPDVEAMQRAAADLYDIGAHSGEDNMDLTIPPPPCHVRRVGGVSPNVMWQSAPLRFDVARLPEGDIFFQMAKFAVQSVGCMESRQSADMLLWPGYVHADTVGNYMMEYLVTMTLANSASEERRIDLQFGKTDAPIGLGWQMIVGDAPATLAQLEPLPVTIAWAGSRRVDNAPYFTKSMLPDGPLALGPGQEKTVSIRLMVLGTSSLPYQIHLKPM